jgi:hypothetical protein
VTQTDPPEENKTETSSREFSQFLIELSMAVHRYAMCPPDHPSPAPAVENVVDRLSYLFDSRPVVSIGVAQRQLVIEGVATDSLHPVLSDLARRLHGRQLRAISFARGTRTREVEEDLQLLASDTERDGGTVGLLASELIPRWEQVVAAALADEGERTVCMGMLELQEDLPETPQDAPITGSTEGRRYNIGWGTATWGASQQQVTS